MRHVIVLHVCKDKQTHTHTRGGDTYVCENHMFMIHSPWSHSHDHPTPYLFSEAMGCQKETSHDRPLSLFPVPECAIYTSGTIQLPTNDIGSAGLRNCPKDSPFCPNTSHMCRVHPGQEAQSPVYMALAGSHNQPEVRARDFWIAKSDLPTNLFESQHCSSTHCVMYFLNKYFLSSYNEPGLSSNQRHQTDKDSSLYEVTFQGGGGEKRGKMQA